MLHAELKKCSEHVLPKPSIEGGLANSDQGIWSGSSSVAVLRSHVPDISFLHKGLSCQIFPLLGAGAVWLGFSIPLLACGPCSGWWVGQPMARHK